ncbi:MAG TPA: GNAT family N-acetyltransferase [Ohtaekwangia sp.]|uniref:GNAT family N-acetyltransferase n=1 Tax=Ohtaekwangia sp. TaxID=2066019 RepID=UPI002F95CA70
MPIEVFTRHDLSHLHDLQPEGWNQLESIFDFYLQSDFCFPLKYTVDGKLAGTGVYILHRDTAWLAHIIVHRDFRYQGIGTILTQALIEHAQKPGIQTILLLATALGEPVYSKQGFQKELTYLFFRHDNVKEVAVPKNAIPFEQRYTESLLALDRVITGEDRSKLILQYVTGAVITIHDNILTGFCLPALGEGPIVAQTPEAGIYLLQWKLAMGVKKIALPENNMAGIHFITEQGFTLYTTGIRMYRGEKQVWHPESIYSRIGGNFG